MNKRVLFTGIICVVFAFIFAGCETEVPVIKSIKLTDISGAEGITVRLGIFETKPSDFSNPSNPPVPVAYAFIPIKGALSEITTELNPWNYTGKKWSGSGNYYIALFKMPNNGAAVTEAWIYTGGNLIGENLSGAAGYNFNSYMTTLNFNDFRAYFP